MFRITIIFNPTSFYIFFLFMQHFVSEGSDVEISCDKDIASLLHWFRVTDAGGVEFLLSFKGDEVKVQSLPSNIEPKGGGRSLVVRDFRRRRDGGSYTCTRINNNQLEFGRVTVLEPPPVLKGLEGRCEIHIFSSLVAASGLLLMVLIATIIYCSSKSVTHTHTHTQWPKVFLTFLSVIVQGISHCLRVCPWASKHV
uniref:Ig-like domain-containing protein n=1 Tax=Denticeps clupeoides TaxID=299321 RepID=A0AAY4AH72_9TELE